MNLNQNVTFGWIVETARTYFQPFSNRPSFHTLLSQFTFSSLQIMFSLFSSVSVDRGLKRNLEQREVKGSIILWKRKKNGIIGWDFWVKYKKLD